MEVVAFDPVTGAGAGVDLVQPAANAPAAIANKTRRKCLMSLLPSKIMKKEVLKRSKPTEFPWA
jgi:hypothetical protein